MGKIFLKKTAILVISIFVLSVVVFYVSRMTPVDPLMSYYGDRVEKMTESEKLIARERLGLEKPIYLQYVSWIKGAVKGDFGISYKYKQPVLSVVSKCVSNTLWLGGLGFVIIFFGSLIIGILCGWRKNSFFDKLMCRLGTMMSCIPEFWLSLVLILIFGVILKILPGSGAYSIGNERNLSDRIVHLILPVFVVVSGHLWYYAYMVRNKIIEEMCSDYVLLAKSKGLSSAKILIFHCVRNILPSYISAMAMSVSHIIGGSYIVEAVYSYPGLGMLSYESARYSDYNMLMLLCLITGVIIITSNMLAQIINERLNPQIRLSEAVNIKGGDML